MNQQSTNLMFLSNKKFRNIIVDRKSWFGLFWLHASGAHYRFQLFVTNNLIYFHLYNRIVDIYFQKARGINIQLSYVVLPIINNKSVHIISSCFLERKVPSSFNIFPYYVTGSTRNSDAAQNRWWTQHIVKYGCDYNNNNKLSISSFTILASIIL